MNPNNTPPEPPCPACGSTPASLIEDCISTDLTPWWRHYAQKFNPFRLIRRQTEMRLIRRQTEMRWIPMGECDQAIWSHSFIVTQDITSPLEIHDTRSICLHDLRFAHHWCPLPPLP